MRLVVSLAFLRPQDSRGHTNLSETKLIRLRELDDRPTNVRPRNIIVQLELVVSDPINEPGAQLYLCRFFHHEGFPVFIIATGLALRIDCNR